MSIKSSQEYLITRDKGTWLNEKIQLKDTNTCNVSLVTLHASIVYCMQSLYTGTLYTGNNYYQLSVSTAVLLYIIINIIMILSNQRRPHAKCTVCLSIYKAIKDTCVNTRVITRDRQREREDRQSQTTQLTTYTRTHRQTHYSKQKQTSLWNSK